MTTEISVPQLGESVTEATVATWFKKVGDAVSEDEVIAELETDKVTLEVNAPKSGVITKISAEEGATVNVGQLIAELDENATVASAESDDSEAEADQDDDTQEDVQDVEDDDSADDKDDNNIEVFAENNELNDVDEKAIDESLNEDVSDSSQEELGTAEEGGTAGEDAMGGLAATIESEIAKEQGETFDEGNNKEATEKLSDVDGSGNKLSPAVAKFAADRGLDLSEMTGSGKGGRVTKGDILQDNLKPKNTVSEAKSSAKPKPVSTPAKPVIPKPRAETVANFSSAAKTASSTEERIKMSKLRKVIASRLKQSQETNATLSTFNEIDMAKVIAIRTKYKAEFEQHHQVKLGFMSFFVRAATVALQEYTHVNDEIDGDDIVYKNYYHIGVAVGTDQGLVVPVVRDANHKSLAEIENEIVNFAEKARSNQIALNDLSGGTFSITNGGVYGSMLSTPIINPPQSAILGMHAITKRPVVVDDKIVIRPVMMVALSYDHRIIDGKEAVQFLLRIKQLLEDPERLLFNL
ncbi:MAG: 2-oxoglutarate dehydrogenase complex dihydrolipoyllysine-residue succinyltransferase [Pseudomonadota bacterium]